METAVRCAICRDVIGVYEPLVAIDTDSVRPTSLAREPDLGDNDGMLIHRYCSPGATAADDRGRR